MSNDQRRLERLSSIVEAILLVEGAIETETIDISMGGIKVISPVPIEAGQTVPIQLRLNSGTEKILLEVKGVICHQSQKGESWHLGIQFSEMESSTSFELYQVLRARGMTLQKSS